MEKAKKKGVWLQVKLKGEKICYVVKAIQVNSPVWLPLKQHVGN